MKVVLTDDALADLQSIARHIARDNPTRARSFVRELVAQAKALGDLPERFPLVERHAASGVRRRVHGNYLIFYRVEPQRVVVFRILHGARDYAAVLFPDD